MSFSFDPQQGLIFVPAELWGPNGSAVLRLALDTGATFTVVNMGMLVALGYDPALIFDRIQVTTGSGVEFVPGVPLDKIMSLGQKRAEFPVLGYTLPPGTGVDDLLGLDFFSWVEFEYRFSCRISGIKLTWS